jgi:hypothetical protein
MNTILLNPVTWDLMKDSSGNIAMASDPYSQAQDAASEIQTFKGEVYYDTTIGVPFDEEVMGKAPPLSYIRSLFVAAALRVPGTAGASCFFMSFVKRKLIGQVQIVNDLNQKATVAF